MRKLKRRKIIREALEARLLKNERRIQAIAEESYKLRLSLEQLDATPKQTPLTKVAREELAKTIEQKEQTDAIPASGTQEGSEVGTEAGK